jgi:hypothetical protein
MNEMIQTSLHAVLIKVAALGLEPKHLGKSLNEMYPLFLDLVFKINRIFPTLLYIDQIRIPSMEAISVVRVASTKHWFWTVLCLPSESFCE